jgi:hypothetical protein
MQLRGSIKELQSLIKWLSKFFNESYGTLDLTFLN